MVTNYNTCNYYYDKGCEYGVISSEITLDEINEIRMNTKMKLFLNVLGYQIMGYSRRHLLDNYFKSTDMKRDNNTYIIKNNNEDYIIQEEENGNALYFGKPLNGSVIVNQVDVDYLILNDNNFDKDKFIKTLKLYKELMDTKDENIIKEIDDLVGDNRGFFFTKTIYKVKKNG
jgi:putative protease